jgi:Fis family transcriptional regulator
MVNIGSTAVENTQAVENASLVNRAVEASSLNGAALDVAGNASIMDSELVTKLDSYSLESIVELKISRFLDQIGTYYPESLHALIMRKSEKPLLAQILRRTGGNQVHAARILGINRNTLRKKMKVYGI